MDMSLGIESYGYSAFDSLMPGNMGMPWNPQGGTGEAILLDGEKQNFPKTAAKPGKKGASETKNAAALKSHCEAERRRRERINGHFATLRNFLPDADKMDKATLLAEVIHQVKLLEKQAIEATKGLVIPTDTDDVTVEPYTDPDVPEEHLSFRASLCCDYKPELIPEIRRALQSFNVTLTNPEISTLGTRVRSVFIVTARKDQIGDNKRRRFPKSIRDALHSVLEKLFASEELLPGETYLNKRRKVSFLGNSSLSS